MKVKLLSRLVLVVLLIGTLVMGAGCAQSSKTESKEGVPQSPKTESKEVVLKLGHVTQANHPYHLASEKFAKLLSDKTGGRIKVTIFPARQLGGDREMFEMVQNGSLDMNLMPVATLGGFTPVMMGLQLPWLIDDYEIMEKAYTGDAAKKMYEALEKEVPSIKAFALYEAGLRDFVNNKRPINSMADLKGLKFRSVQSPITLDTQQMLGLNPVPMAYGEQYSAMQTGVIDGSDLEPASIWSEKFYEVAKYISMSNHIPFPAVLVMNTDKFKSLSVEDQKAIMEAAQEAIADNIKVVKASNEEALAKMKEKGVNINQITDVTPFKDATKGLYDKYTASHPAVKQFVDDVNKLKGK